MAVNNLHMRYPCRQLAVVAALIAGATAACADRTVTTHPAATSNVSTPSTAVESAGTSPAVDAADDADLAEVEQLLRDTDADLTAADQDIATPEGDPAQ
ncbi:MAG: hypothetical protein QOJ00_1547 [Actinomycetota bacterium]